MSILAGFAALVMADMATGASTALYKEWAGDPKAARANAVVQARRIVKHGKKLDPQYDADADPEFLKAIKDFPDIRQQVLVDEKDLISQGRRADIKEEYAKQLKEWEAKEGEKGERPVEPLVVRLAIGGSGDAAWRTHCDIKGAMTAADKLKMEKHTVGDKKTVYYMTGTKTHEWNFAGPGGPGTSGDAWVGGGGKRDVGSNSIAAIVENATKVVATAVRQAQAVSKSLGIKQPIVILIKGHSRGAVAAGHVANGLKAEFPDATVELTQIDPVPGPSQGGENQKVDVGTIDQSTVVYGVFSGHAAFSFTPQQVFNAKRLIISQQGHGVGIQNGFKYEGRLYRGNTLNSLPPGVYRDNNGDISVAGELERIGTSHSVEKAFRRAYHKRYPFLPGTGAKSGNDGTNYDAGRQERLEALLQGHADAMKSEDWGDICEDAMVSLFAGDE